MYLTDPDLVFDDLDKVGRHTRTVHMLFQAIPYCLFPGENLAETRVLFNSFQKRLLILFTEDMVKVHAYLAVNVLEISLVSHLVDFLRITTEY